MIIICIFLQMETWDLVTTYHAMGVQCFGHGSSAKHNDRIKWKQAAGENGQNKEVSLHKLNIILKTSCQFFFKNSFSKTSKINGPLLTKLNNLTDGTGIFGYFFGLKKNPECLSHRFSKESLQFILYNLIEEPFWIAFVKCSRNKNAILHHISNYLEQYN